MEAVDRGYAESGPRGAYLEVAEMLVARSKLRYVSSTDIALAMFTARGGTKPFIGWKKHTRSVIPS